MTLLDIEKIMHARQRAIERIFSEQTKEGYWISKRITDPRSSNVDRTAFVLADLSTVPELSKDHRVLLGIKHLITSQKLDGGWSDLKVEPSRPTVTSYVLWALGKFDARSSQEVERGVSWLEQTQCDDGGWTEIVERPWEGGIRAGETQPWITASCLRGLKNCPQAQKDVIQEALSFLQKTQRSEGSWEGRMGTNIVLLTFREVGLTIEREMVRRGVDYELSFQKPDGLLPDAWHAKTVMHMVSSLNNFLELGVPLEDQRISKMFVYLRTKKKDLMEQLNKYANLAIFKTLEDLNEKFEISLFC